MIDIEKVMYVLKNRGLFTMEDYMLAITIIESALTELDRLQQNQLTLNRYLELEAKGINISKIDWDEKKMMLHILQTNKEMLRSDK